MAQQNSSIVCFLAPAAQGCSCADLRAQAPQIAHYMGYHTGGIVKGSMAAHGMSLEAHANGGKVPKMKHGGVSTSLQCIGAPGGWVATERQAQN